MIESGDRILLGLSGGKDSLTLLHVLYCLKRMIPITFTLACATVDPQTPSFDPSPLKMWVCFNYYFIYRVVGVRVYILGLWGGQTDLREDDEWTFFCFNFKWRMWSAYAFPFAYHAREWVSEWVLSLTRGNDGGLLMTTHPPFRFRKPIFYSQPLYLRLPASGTCLSLD